MINTKKAVLFGTTAVLGLTTLGALQSVSYAATSGGAGTAQITYNVNKMEPTDPTSNPDFAVLIPSAYNLADQNIKTPVKGEISIQDADDITKTYAGSEKVDISFASAKNFAFDNGGAYQIVDGSGTKIAGPITLDSTTTSSAVNAQLTKKGAKTASADTLTFTYTVK
ncbi:hypothetical protein [Lactococcus garvieae]|uniref:hypothetical protein n=1 Tax=Lactococcus garvieae TaxID=1363 RepID=UPI0021F8BE28|nr:hypothetical protein [Lactococcus garvieae]UYT12323.1 hypothetical protein OF800_10115 [Lactococcus garvieae]